MSLPSYGVSSTPPPPGQTNTTLGAAKGAKLLSRYGVASLLVTTFVMTLLILIFGVDPEELIRDDGEAGSEVALGIGIVIVGAILNWLVLLPSALAGIFTRKGSVVGRVLNVVTGILAIFCLLAVVAADDNSALFIGVLSVSVVLAVVTAFRINSLRPAEPEAPRWTPVIAAQDQTTATQAEGGRRFGPKRHR